MSDEEKCLFHIGGRELLGANELLENYSYKHLPLELIKEFPDIIAVKNNEYNNTSKLFLISKEAIGILRKEDLIKLPAHQIFVEKNFQPNESKLNILKLKEFKSFDLDDDGRKLINFINKNYIKPWGTIIDNNMVEINNNFHGIVERRGSSLYVFEGDFGSKYKQIMIWNNQFKISGDVNIYPEINSSNNVIWHLRVYYDNYQEIVFKDIYINDIDHKPFPLHIENQSFPIRISVFVKGKGTIKVGNIHLRSELEGKNFLAIGGRRLLQKNNMKEEIGYYFNAGDLKPPLNVYFSGFRPAEGYEGRWMMGSFGAPFILIYDPRLIGGSFYRGKELEQEIINIIKNKLKILNFSDKELVLSGLSMGTYASLYYGSLLEPHAIVIGKPLANIGHLAMHSRIAFPYDWDLAMDTILHLQGELSVRSATALDNEFWDIFNKANFEKTTFIIAHMLQDTDTPFMKIFNLLKEKYESAKIIHKGLEGHHNDDTIGITSWFYMEYKKMLTNDFDRKY